MSFAYEEFRFRIFGYPVLFQIFTEITNLKRSQSWLQISCSLKCRLEMSSADPEP